MKLIRAKVIDFPELHKEIKTESDGVEFIAALIKNDAMFHIDDDPMDIIWGNVEMDIDLMVKRHQELWEIGDPWHYADKVISEYLDEMGKS